MINKKFLNILKWSILRPIGFFKLSLLRKKKSNSSIKEDLKQYFSAIKSVQNGPFKGMKYPFKDVPWGNPYNKLIGSYEKELWNVVEDCCFESYSEIIDIGSAEGYYAVGFAMRLTNTKVYAFEIDEESRNLCRIMAKHNNLENKVVCLEKITPQILGSFNFSGKGLVISDCEGYELNLFTNGTMKNLINCDLLIETHDFLNPKISHELIRTIEITHNIRVIKSLSDLDKLFSYRTIKIPKMDLLSRLDALSERRPDKMIWLFCKSK